MIETFLTTFTQALFYIAGCMAIAAVIAVAGLLLMIKSVRNLRVPPGADIFTTMHYVPLPVVILFDLLDLGLDFFSAPIAWLMLDRMGLESLRNTATLQSAIPFTGPIPTLTITWILARLMGMGKPVYRPRRPPPPGARRRPPPRRYLEDVPRDSRRPPPRRSRRPPEMRPERQFEERRPPRHRSAPPRDEPPPDSREAQPNVSRDKPIIIDVEPEENP